MPVSLSDLPEQVLRFALGPYLVTVGADRAPRVASVSVAWQGDSLVAGLGKRTAANLREHSAVTLLWPATVPGEHALLIDGSAEVQETPDAGPTVLIHPERAVLHVTRSRSGEESASTGKD